MNKRIITKALCVCSIVLFSTFCTPEGVIIPLSFITGECLKGTKIEFIRADTTQDGIYEFAFKPDMSINKEDLNRSDNHLQWRFTPSDSIFNSFGLNANAVKNEYERILSGLDRSQYSFFLDEGISLIADKEFMGIEPGNNLAGLLYDQYYQDSFILPLESGFDGSRMIFFHSISEVNLCFQIRFDKKEFYPVEETVIFSISIPVRVVQYLTWLNNRITDENATMTWKDEVLTCTFQSKRGLHKTTD